MFWILLSVLTGILLLYFLFWPVSPKPKGVFKPLDLPSLTGIYGVNTLLQTTERFGDGFCHSPESVTADTDGRIYAGMEDGRIMRFSKDGEHAVTFSHTGGRPLGMAFDRDGNLIVADQKRGLLSVRSNGSVSVLTNEADGRPISYANDLDIARDGTIYFSDFQFYRDQDGLADFVDGRPLTRLLAYNPPSGTTRVVLDGLYAANGVTLGPGDQYVLVNEFFAYRVTRCWLAGPQKGQVEPFIENLPGMPDNITFNGQDIFWVALYTRRSPFYDLLQSKPFLRAVMLRLPAFLLKTEPAKYGFVLGLDLDGNVIHNLQDPGGEFVSQVTSVFEHDRMLYLGNIGDDTIHRIPRPT